MDIYPQAQLSLEVREKPELGSLSGVMRVIRDVEKKLGDDGRVLVRYSGTETKARVMIEGIDEVRIRGWAEEIAGALAKGCRVQVP